MSEIILKELSWSNMFSYGEQNSLQLNKTPITQLLASNGMGKSSVALIIQELLYNKNIKGLKKSEIINRYLDTKKWWASLTFDIVDTDKTDEYRITSTRTGATSNVVLLKNGVDISEHKVLDTYKKLHSIIGRDFETFVQLTYQSSTDSLEFLKATDTNRKRFLINLFNLTKYTEIGERIKPVLVQREKELATKNGELIAVVRFIEETVLPEKATFKPEKEAEVTDLLIRIKEIQQEIDSSQKLNIKIDSNNQYKKELSQIEFRMDLEEPQDPKVATQIQELQVKISTANNIIKQDQKKLAALDLSDTCYACHQHIDNTKAKELNDTLQENIKQLKDSIQMAQQELKSLQDKQSEYTLQKKQYEVNQKKIDRFSYLSQMVDNSLPDTYPNYDTLKSELIELQKDVAYRQKEQQDIQDYNNSVRTRNAKIDGLRDQLINYKARREILETELVDMELEVNRLNILKKAFSTNGLVSYKLESVTKQLENNINYYLSLLSDGQFQVVFKLVGDKLNILIVADGEEVSISSLSGGEFSRVQTSVLLAIRNTLSMLGSKNINLLFLDEVFAVLDDAGKEAFIDVLLQEEGVNIFMISHEYEHPLIPKLTIEKTNNISKLVTG